MRPRFDTEDRGDKVVVRDTITGDALLTVDLEVNQLGTAAVVVGLGPTRAVQDERLLEEYGYALLLAARKMRRER